MPDDPRDTTAALTSQDLQQQLSEAARQHQAGRPEAAEPVYRKILELDPQQPDAHHLLGLALSQRGQHDQAREHIHQAIALRQESPEYHNSLGVVLGALGQPDDAQRSYRQAIDLLPAYAEAHYNLAALLHRRGDLPGAAEHYRHVLNEWPQDPAVHNNLGCVLRDGSQLDEARKHFHEALRFKPDYEPASRNLEAMASPGEAPAAPEAKWDPPILISAPTERNGVTLLQRLLNSTRQIIVYGEDTVFFRWMPRLFFEKLALHAQAGAQGAEVRKRFTEETTEFWTSNLWPDTDLYARTLGECFNRIVGVYQTSARNMGSGRWGIKQPLTEVRQLAWMRQLMPNSRLLYIYRNLYDVARSAKARKFARGPEQVADLGRRWQTNLLPVLKDPPANTLVIRHEDLSARPDEVIPQIETFADVSGIDRTVMERRFNTFQGRADQGYSPSGYIAPEALTDEELGALRGAAAEALALTEYQNDPA